MNIFIIQNIIAPAYVAEARSLLACDKDGLQTWVIEPFADPVLVLFGDFAKEKTRISTKRRVAILPIRLHSSVQAYISHPIPFLRL